MVGASEMDSFVGYEANKKRDVLNIKSPIAGGRVTNWDNMELVWHHTFYNQLRVEPQEHCVLVNQPPLTPKACIEKTTQIMMETFGTPALCLANSCQLSLFGAGRTSGTV